MDASDLTCRDEHRREEVRGATLYGLDYVEVSDDQLSLEVFFLGKAPKKIDKTNVRIAGGRRIGDIRVTNVRVHRSPDPTFDDRLEVDVDKYGDFSTYSLSLVEEGLDREGNPVAKPMDGFDPRYSTVDFTFKASCPTDLDCKPEPVCPPRRWQQPEINYLAKDYASFRQLILDRLALIMPDWKERHVPDIGIMLVELLAYVGDYLSYYQDAVATEAYLDTARQRISVRRHARLVDYAMHEGCNARAWVAIETDSNALQLDPGEIYFCTAFPGSPAASALHADAMTNVPPASYETFEPLVADRSAPIAIYQAHSVIHFYTWGDHECCLPKGATRATLADRWIDDEPAPPKKGDQEHGQADNDALPEAPGKEKRDDERPRALENLKVHDVLIFEERVGPKTGNPADADPRHRQAVRLTKVTRAVDALYGTPVVEIEWCAEDALTFPLCVSVRMPPPQCDLRQNISVARGNVILVHHARTVEESIGTVGSLPAVEQCPTDCAPGETIVAAQPFRPPPLKKRPLTFSQPLPACACASQLLVQDPRQALPCISLSATLPALRGDKYGPKPVRWEPRRDLLQSGSNDSHFVVEIDDDGFARLRFGDGESGRMPEAGAAFTASYRIGNGPAGNVGAETITHMVHRQIQDLGRFVVCNPLPAVGGTAPEPVANVKMFAPHAFRSVRARAITADDYAALAADNARRLAERPTLVAAALSEHDTLPGALPVPPLDNPRAGVEQEPLARSPFGTDVCLLPFHRLQAAKAALRWTGSWYEAQVAVDPLGAAADKALLAEIETYLESYRRVGHDLNVTVARYAPIDLALSVCVLPHHLRGHVEAALIEALSNRALPDGTLGFFHPDNLTFGAGIHVSRIVAAAQAVTGVMDARVIRLARYRIGTPAADGANQVPSSGVLALAPFEIARLDADPNFPENGRFTLLMRGGR